MRKIGILSLMACVSLFGCSGDSSVSPEPEVPLAESTVGTEGGALEGDGFSLIVPPGAFASPAELRLYSSTEEHGFEGHSPSDCFRLEGLPEVFSDTLTVRIAFRDSLEDESFIAIGTTELVVTGRDWPSEEEIFDLVPAAEASGFLECKLPPQAGAPEPAVSLGGVPVATGSSSRRLTAVTGYLTSTSTHVILRYPSEKAEFASPLLDYFEGGYDTAISLGIGYEGKLWNWPALVVIEKHKCKHPYGCGIYTKENPPEFTIKVEKVTASEMPNFQIGGLETVFASALFIPDPKTAFEPSRVWWHGAVLNWVSSAHGGPTAPSRPDSLSGNEHWVLQGLPMNLTDGDDMVGYGDSWAALISHVTGEFGETLLGPIYARIRGGDLPAKAFVEGLPEPTYNYWPQFVDRYITGQIYGVESSIFLTRIDDEHSWLINDASDTLRTWPRTTLPSPGYEQLSAQLHRIFLDYSQIDENANLELTIDRGEISADYVSLLVYKAKDGVLTYVGTGDTVHVTGLRDLTLTGHDIVAVVANSYVEEPYTEKTPLKLKARVTGPVGDFNTCRIDVTLMGIYQVEGSPDTEERWGVFPGFEAFGSFTGSTFTGDLLGDGITGTMNVTVDPVTLFVLTFSASGVATGSAGSTTWSIAGSGVAVPLVYQTPTLLRCGDYGEPACTHIGGMTWVWSPNEGPSETLVGRRCAETSEIKIEFSRQD